MWPVWTLLLFYCMFFFYLFVLRGQGTPVSPELRRRQNRIASVIISGSLVFSTVLWSKLLARPHIAPPKRAQVMTAPAPVVAAPAQVAQPVTR